MPDSTSSDGVEMASSTTWSPARAVASSAPIRRSRTWCSVLGPPTKATERWPWSIRCCTASRPPSRSSTPTEQESLPLLIRSTRTTAIPRRRSSAMRSDISRIGATRMPAYALLLEQREVGHLPLGRLRAVADVHGVPRRVEVVLGPQHDVGEERVGDVDHHHADRSAAAGAQLAGRLVADPAELVDRLPHPLLGGRGHQVRGVEHVRDRAHGYAGQRRDVLHAHRAAGRHERQPTGDLNRFSRAAPTGPPG